MCTESEQTVANYVENSLS